MTAFQRCSAHQGGWDELVFVLLPIALFAGLLAVANRRANRARRRDDEPGAARRRRLMPLLTRTLDPRRAAPSPGSPATTSSWRCRRDRTASPPRRPVLALRALAGHRRRRRDASRRSTTGWRRWCGRSRSRRSTARRSPVDAPTAASRGGHLRSRPTPAASTALGSLCTLGARVRVHRHAAHTDDHVRGRGVLAPARPTRPPRWRPSGSACSAPSPSPRWPTGTGAGGRLLGLRVRRRLPRGAQRPRPRPRCPSASPRRSVRGLATAGGVLVAIVAAEEMPAGSRAFAITLISAAGALGAGHLPRRAAARRHRRSAGGAWSWWGRSSCSPSCGSAARHLPESRRYDAAHADVGMAGHGQRFWLLAASALPPVPFTAPGVAAPQRVPPRRGGLLGAAHHAVQHPHQHARRHRAGRRRPPRRHPRARGSWAPSASSPGSLLTVAMVLIGGWPMWGLSVAAAIVGAMVVPALGVYGPELFPTVAARTGQRHHRHPRGDRAASSGSGWPATCRIGGTGSARRWPSCRSAPSSWPSSCWSPTRRRPTASSRSSTRRTSSARSPGRGRVAGRRGPTSTLASVLTPAPHLAAPPSPCSPLLVLGRRRVHRRAPRRSPNGPSTTTTTEETPPPRPPSPSPRAPRWPTAKASSIDVFETPGGRRAGAADRLRASTPRSTPSRSCSS